MPRTRINPRLAKLHHCYTVDEAARLLGVHRNTVRHWLKRGGLAAIDGRRPTLIKGAQLRSFLEARRAAAKRPCPPGSIFCFPCRVPRAPALGMADFMTRETGAGDLRALCETCGTEMHRRTRQADLATILPGIEVRIVRGPTRIAVWPTPSPNCALRPDERT